MTDANPAEDYQPDARIATNEVIGKIALDPKTAEMSEKLTEKVWNPNTLKYD